MRQLFRELKRRNVCEVVATYTVVGFVVIQAANLIFPALDIPPWAYSLVVVRVLLRFPIALALAWAFKLTPEGVRRSASARRRRAGQRMGSRSPKRHEDSHGEFGSRLRVRGERLGL